MYDSPHPSHSLAASVSSNETHGAAFILSFPKRRTGASYLYMRILTANLNIYFRATLALAIGMGFALGAAAATFRARLAPVAIDAAMKANVTGSGSLTAVLTGS